jgi:hypothetical protein
MSNNLNLDQLVDGQNQPEITINDALGQLDAALTENLSVDLSAGNQTISSANFRRYFMFAGDGHSVTRSITIPNIKRFFSVFNNGTGLINVVKGSTSLPLPQGAHALYYSSGGADVLREIADVGKDLNDNWTATTDPGAGDDIADGYSPGTRWRNTVTGELFLCVDNTSSAAVWVHISLTADELGSMAFEDTTDYYTSAEFDIFLAELLATATTTYINAVGNIGTGEDDLLTHEFPANTLLDDEDSVWFEGSVVLGASANDKRLRVHFGTSGNTLIFDTGVLSITGETHITIIGRVIRTGIDSQKAYCAFISNDPTVQGLSGFTAALDQDLSDPVTLRITGEATDDGDIVAETLSVGKNLESGAGGGGSAGFISREVFETSGTWSKPVVADESRHMVLVEIVGAGGSGSSRSTTGNAGGGGGGGYLNYTLPLSLFDAMEDVVIGAGGVGVSGNTNGNDGGTTSLTVGAIVLQMLGAKGCPSNNTTSNNVIGGACGFVADNTTSQVLGPFYAVSTTSERGGINAGAGGTVTSARVHHKGGFSIFGGGGGGACSSDVGTGDRSGGTSALGGDGGNGGANTGGNGGDGQNPGGGGGGAVQGGTSGAGGNGQIIITVF